MEVIGTVTMNTYQAVTIGEEAVHALLSSDSRRGGGIALVISTDNRPSNGEQSSGKLLRTGCL